MKTLTPPAPTGEATRESFRPGIVVAVVGATVGVLAHQFVGVLSPHVVAIVIGVALANIGGRSVTYLPGLRLVARYGLRAGIVLIGVRLSLGDVLQVGLSGLLAVVCVVAVTFFGTRWIGRRLGVSDGLSTLIASGYSICGASAIAAARPFTDADEEEVAYSIGLVTLCGSLAIVVLPPLAGMLQLSDAAFGAWVGASVHDVGQVVATASTRSSTSLELGVLVKLVRIALLAPLLSGLAIAQRKRAGSGCGGAAIQRSPVVPTFLVLFLAAVVVRTTGVLSDPVIGATKSLETLMLGAGLVGLGSSVRISRLRRLGGRPLVLGLISWVVVAGASFVAVHVAIV